MLTYWKLPARLHMDRMARAGCYVNGAIRIMWSKLLHIHTHAHTLKDTQAAAFMIFSVPSMQCPTGFKP